MKEIEEEKPNIILSYELSVVNDLQDTYEYGKLYLIGHRNRFWKCAFHCPCGCGELLELLLLKEVSPHWSIEFSDESHVNIYPSIWKSKGCKSHFFIRSNRIIWV